jgi:hypothetical protein
LTFLRRTRSNAGRNVKSATLAGPLGLNGCVLGVMPAQEIRCANRQQLRT